MTPGSTGMVRYILAVFQKAGKLRFKDVFADFRIFLAFTSQGVDGFPETFNMKHPVKARYLLPVCLSLPLAACAFLTPQQVIPTAISLYNQQKVGTYYTEAALIEGKTQKEYVLRTIGMPDISGVKNQYSYITYTSAFRQAHIKAKLRIVRRDGTDVRVLFGKGEKYTALTVYFDMKGIITNIYIS